MICDSLGRVLPVAYSAIHALKRCILCAVTIKQHVRTSHNSVACHKRLLGLLASTTGVIEVPVGSP